ncbi:MAG TPA: protein kinase [Pyrinomonadaceae bacterium]|nr:protein kinase [Pyrinomonadaceae bacterium]
MPGLERLIGEVLEGKYRLESLLGQGGMGAVYLATHLGTDRAVALKLIAPQFMRNEEFVERFQREARAAGRLRHPNVVDVTDFGFADSHGERVAYLVMEYLDGCTLADVLAEEKRLPLDWVAEILEQVASAVEEAHRQGIVHRDLKPDNIWLEPTRLGGYRVKVLDFGIAKLGEAGFDEETEPPRPAVDPLPAQATQTAQSSLEVLQASIARAAASLRPDAGEDGAGVPEQTEAATQIFTSDEAAGGGRDARRTQAGGVEAATQLYAPPAAPHEQRAARVETDDEQGTRIFAPPFAGAEGTDRGAQAETSDEAGASHTAGRESAVSSSADEDGRARVTARVEPSPRATRVADDADRTRVLDAAPPAHAGATPRQMAADGTRAGGAALTRVGSIMGTPLYMSPEQCRGERLDARSDIYSLGVIAYQMLTGETPFAGDMVTVMRRHVADAPPPPRSKNRKVSKAVERVVLAALAKERAARPQTATAFASSLRANSAGTGTLLRRAFALYSEHFPTFLRLTLFAHVPVFVTTALLFSIEVADARGALGGVIGGVALAFASLLHTVASFIANSIISGVTAVLVTQLQLAPLRHVSLRPAFAVLRRRWRPFLRTSVGVTLRMIFGFILFVIPGFWMMVKYALYAPVVLLEGLTKKAARQRANELSRRSRRSVVALLLINMAVPMAIGAVVGGMSIRANRGGESNVSAAPDPGGVKVSTSTGRGGVRVTRTEGDAPAGGEAGSGAAGDANEGQGAAGESEGGESKAGASRRPRRRVDLSGKAASHALSLLNIIVVPLISITTALLYLRLRLMGGETMRDTLAQFEEFEPPRTRWQQRMRERLTARGNTGQRRDTHNTGGASQG